MGALAVLQVDVFPKSVILASCNFVGRPFVACYACVLLLFSIPLDNRLLVASKIIDFCWLFVN